MARIKSMTPIEGSGLTLDTSNEIYDQIARFAGYGFNKSHAAAYAAISFQTAWLKAHHTESFFASAMNMHLDKVDEISLFMNDLKKRHVAVWRPSVNQSRARFEPIKLKKPWHGRDFGICYGLSAIRGVGPAAAQSIEEERNKSGAYKSIQDFTTRLRSAIGRPALVALAKSGAFDCFDSDRARTLAEAQRHRQNANENQFSMFDTMDAEPEFKVEPLTSSEVLDNELDVLGHYMSAHPLEGLRNSLVEVNQYFSDFVLEKSTRSMRRATMPAIVIDTDVRRTKGGDIMAILTLSDPDGTYEAIAFGDTWSEIRHMTRKKSRILCEMNVSIRDDERRLIIESADPLQIEKIMEAA